jgi:hypothetical protein
MEKRTLRYMETVDVNDLRAVRAPMLRALFPRFVERLELRRHERDLLAEGRWARVVVVPQLDRDGRDSRHLFDIFGEPAEEPDVFVLSHHARSLKDPPRTDDRVQSR